MPHLLDEKNVKMLTSHKVFSEAELQSRCEIMLDNYCKQVRIEASTMIYIAQRMICEIRCRIQAFRFFGPDLLQTQWRTRKAIMLGTGERISLIRASCHQGQASSQMGELRAACRSGRGDGRQSLLAASFLWRTALFSKVTL